MGKFLVKVGQSCATLCDPMDCLWNSPGQNTGMGSLSLLPRIFPTQGSNPDLPHCKWILYQQSHKGSPRLLEWVAIPSPEDLLDPGIKPGSPALQGDSLPTELSGKPMKVTQSCPTVCDPMNYTVHGVPQDRILEWAAYPFSRIASKTCTHYLKGK